MQEFYYTLGSTIFYFIAMIVQFAVSSGYNNSGVAAAVSLMSIYIYDIHLFQYEINLKYIIRIITGIWAI
jgi:hypothetical protein